MARSRPRDCLHYVVGDRYRLKRQPGRAPDSPPRHAPQPSIGNHLNDRMDKLIRGKLGARR